MDDLLSSIRKLIGEDEPEARRACGEADMPSPRLNRRIKPSDPLPEVVGGALREALANADRAITAEADGRVHADRVRQSAEEIPRISAADRAAAERTRNALLRAIDECGADETVPDGPVVRESGFPFDRPDAGLSHDHPAEADGLDAVLPTPVWLPGAYTKARDEDGRGGNDARRGRRPTTSQAAGRDGAHSWTSRTPSSQSSRQAAPVLGAGKSGRVHRPGERAAPDGDDIVGEAIRRAVSAMPEEPARSGAEAPADRSAGPARGHGEAIEALVKDAVRPLLREWIDANLQTIVERVVREEIARMAKGR